MYTASGAIAHSQQDASHSVQQFAPLVHKIAHHMQSRLPASVAVDDLIQAGMLGLLDALGRFEDGQGAQFETYASQRIRGAMLDELRQNDWLPRGVRKTQRDIERVLRRVEQRLGRSAAESEIASEMGVDVRQYQALLSTEGVTLKFQTEGIKRLAEIAYAVNEKTENIGARRLYTVMEKLLEEISFDAGKRNDESITIDADYVDARLKELAQSEDLARYVL